MALFSKLFVLSIAAFASATTHAGLLRSQSAPVAPLRLKPGPCRNPACERVGKVLLNANKYALSTWWTDRGFDHKASDGYLDFKGVAENNIRPIAAESGALAVSLRLGLYDANVVGARSDEAEQRTIELIRSLAHRHRANSPDGWGSVWQSPLWAAQTARAAWLLWPQLDPQMRTEILKMLESEAEWVMSNKDHPVIKTYRDRSGKIISPGDTGTEENAWDSEVLMAVTAMMPGSPNNSRWMNKIIELELAAQSRPSDIDRSDIYNGKPLSQWLPGSNVNEDGTVVNHNIIHPDYMVAGLFVCSPVNWYSVAGLPVPNSGLFNNDVIYRALADLRFAPGEIVIGKPILPPGGTMFIADSAKVYFPQGNDWGPLHPLNFAVADAVTSLFSSDPELRRRAAMWEGKHVEFTLQQQARFKDGHTFLDSSEFNYAGREEWIADFAARAYLLHWLSTRHAVTFTNKAY